VRKVTACAVKRGIDKQIERLKIGTTDPELLKYNALSKVPTLITDVGTACGTTSTTYARAAGSKTNHHLGFCRPPAPTSTTSCGATTAVLTG
jgi:hypothetical protein